MLFDIFTKFEAQNGMKFNLKASIYYTLRLKYK